MSKHNHHYTSNNNLHKARQSHLGNCRERCFTHLEARCTYMTSVLFVSPRPLLPTREHVYQDARQPNAHRSTHLIGICLPSPKRHFHPFPSLVYCFLFNPVTKPSSFPEVRCCEPKLDLSIKEQVPDEDHDESENSFVHPSSSAVDDSSDGDSQDSLCEHELDAFDRSILQLAGHLLESSGAVRYKCVACWLRFC